MLVKGRITPSLRINPKCPSLMGSENKCAGKEYNPKAGLRIASTASIVKRKIQ
jgi:hypothetical protein